MGRIITTYQIPVLVTLEVGPLAWCKCGKSMKLPFCDGTHQGTQFTAVSFKKPEKRAEWICTGK